MKKIYNIEVDSDKKYNIADKGDIKLKLNSNVFLGVTSAWQFTTLDIKKIGLEHIKANKNLLNLQDKTIYRYSDLNLPRQKVELLKDKFNIKISRDPSKSDIHIISLKTIGKMIDFSWNNNTLSFKEFFDICVELKNKNLLNDEALNELRTSMSFIDKNSVFCAPRRHWNNNTASFHQEFYNLLDEHQKEYADGNRNIVIQPNNFLQFDNILNSKALVVFDTDISEIIYADLAVITNDQYAQVESMVKSNDYDNRALALEMLANCNIDKSFDVVSGIFFWYYDYLKTANNWNTVNVKAMRNLLTNYEGNHSYQNICSFDKYIELLMNDDKLTKFAVDKTREKLLSTLLSQMIGPTAKVFKVDLENLVLQDKFYNITNE